MTRVLLFGADGMLGTDLAAAAPSSIELVRSTQGDSDITDAAAVERAVAAARPEIVINAAAYTDVDGAERSPELAERVNGDGPGNIGRVAAKAGAAVIHYSTDYIFSGTPGVPLREDAPARPVNAYARSKLSGEQRLAASGARYLIIRTQWLFGLNGRSFPRLMRDRARARQETRVVNDQFGRPTYTRDLSRATWALLSRLDQAGPAIHVANSGNTTWYELARRVFLAAGVPELLTPCTTADFPRPAARPAWSVLDTARFDALATPLPPWEDAVDRFLRELEAAPSL